MYGAMPMCLTLSLLTTQSVIEIGSLFALLNDIAVFLRESYKRMSVWESESQDQRHKRLSPVGETRWWPKDAALRKVFGSFAHPNNSHYVDVILTLTAIQDQVTMKTTTQISAHGFIEALLKYEMALTALIFLRIFEQTSPLSKYLQTEGMDIQSAHRMVRTTHECLRSMSRDFVSIKAVVDRFVQWANEKLQEQYKETELEVEATLPPKRRKKKLIRPG